MHKPELVSLQEPKAKPTQAHRLKSFMAQKAPPERQNRAGRGPAGGRARQGRADTLKSPMLFTELKRHKKQEKL